MSRCEKCPVPCKTGDYNPYNEDCDIWVKPLHPTGEVYKFDIKAYEKAVYRSYNEVPPSERKDESRTQG